MWSTAVGHTAPGGYILVRQLLRSLQSRLGARYWMVLVVGQSLAWLPIAILWFLIIAPYYRASPRDVVFVVVAAGVLTSTATAYTAVRARPSFRLVVAWCRADAPTPRHAEAAWAVSTSSAYEQYRRDVVVVNSIAVIPSCLVAIILWDVTPFGAFGMVLSCVIPAAFATVMGFGLVEILMKPVIEDIAEKLPQDFTFIRRGLPLQRRLRLSALVVTSATAAAAVSLIGRGSSKQLLVGVAVSAAVGLFVSGWFDLILAHSVTGPVESLRRGLEQVERGDFSARVPVMSSDELGELAGAFNRMVHGLGERARMHSAFTTYMDKEVARIILAGPIPEDGYEVEASILFCDIKGFTAFAEQTEPADVIGSLNAIFSVVVPVIERHGGHIDKFLGDGLLALFGAPEEQEDHADRAVAAAREIVAAVRAAPTDLSMVAGVNTGRVVAGAVGGSGRLTFSVIGDAVNIAARVEAATRETGDDVLLTSATLGALRRPTGVVPRGFVMLKGKSRPIEIFAPSVPELPASSIA